MAGGKPNLHTSSLSLRGAFAVLSGILIVLRSAGRSDYDSVVMRPLSLILTQKSTC